MLRRSMGPVILNLAEKTTSKIAFVAHIGIPTRGTATRVSCPVDSKNIGLCGGYDKSSRHRSWLDLNPGTGEINYLDGGVAAAQARHGLAGIAPAAPVFTGDTRHKGRYPIEFCPSADRYRASS